MNEYWEKKEKSIGSSCLTINVYRKNELLLFQFSNFDQESDEDF